MNRPLALTDLMAEVIMVDVRGDEDQAHLARRLAAELSTHRTDHPVAVLAGPPEELPALPGDREHRARLFLSLLDDPTTDFARKHIERLMPEEIRLPEPALLRQLLRNAELRARFLEQHEAWTAAQVAAFAGSRAKNTSALAGRWRSEGRIFNVEHRGEALYPAFQFDAERRRPKPAMEPVVRVFAEHEGGPWELALWLAAPHPRLGGPPVAALDRDPEAVVEAARATFDLPA